MVSNEQQIGIYRILCCSVIGYLNGYNNPVGIVMPRYYVVTLDVIFIRPNLLIVGGSGWEAIKSPFHFSQAEEHGESYYFANSGPLVKRRSCTGMQYTLGVYIMQNAMVMVGAGGIAAGEKIKTKAKIRRKKDRNYQKWVKMYKKFRVWGWGWHPSKFPPFHF